MQHALMHKGKIVLPGFTYTTERGSRGRNILAEAFLRKSLGIELVPAGGSAPLQGYHTAGDVIATTVDQIDTNALWQEFQQALALLNAQRQPLVDLLTYTVREPVVTIPQVGNNASFEKASEFGVPVAVRTGVTYFQMGFDFDWYDTGARFTWEFLAEATAEQIRSVNDAIMEADSRLVFGEVLRTLYRNTNRTADIQKQAYTVYSFYNGTDGTVPPTYKTNTFLNTHTHYLTSGAATVDSGDLDQILDDFASHGYDTSSGYNLVMGVNKVEADVIRNFRSVVNGGTARYDFIPALGTPNFLLPLNFRINDDAAVRRPQDTYRGMKVLGQYGDMLILQDSYFPAGYLTAFATGGPENIGNPIGIREHARPELRGLRLVKGRSPDYPLQESYWQRGFGTGIRHRGAGIIMKITAGAYTIPTQYV